MENLDVVLLAASIQFLGMQDNFDLNYGFSAGYTACTIMKLS